MTKKLINRASVPLTLALLLVSGILPAFAVTAVDVDPGWQQADPGGDASWIVSADNTSAGDDFKFTFGQAGGSDQWNNVGAHSQWVEFTDWDFGHPCSDTTYNQKLDHLNGPAFDNAQTFVDGGSPCFGG